MYFVTGFTYYNMTDKGIPEIGHMRTFGYYETETDAIEAVLGNYCDIFEYYYTYAVVEHIEPGLYCLATKRWFFKWNEAVNKYEAIEPFEDFLGNYALG